MEPELPPDPTSSQSALSPEVQRIIVGGRNSAPDRRGSPGTVAALSALAAFLLWICQTPVEFSPAAWAALIPLTILIRPETLPRWSYRLLTLAGFLWAVATLQWMRLGHWAMYGALFSLAIYLSLYFPLFVAVSRRVVRTGLPVALAVPVVWTSLELTRAYLLTGFSWYYLGHSQYRWLSLIQISDLTGAYGVSFVIAFCAAAIAEQIPDDRIRSWHLDLRPSENSGRHPFRPAVRRRLSLGAAILTLMITCGYGAVRLHSSNQFPAGPAVALIQGNFSPEVKHDVRSWNGLYNVHRSLTESCRDLRPDLIIWPETMFRWPVQTVAEGVTDEELITRLPGDQLEFSDIGIQEISAAWRSNEVQTLLASQSQAAGAAMIIGLEAHEVTKTGLNAYNSAAFIRPDTGYIDRYDKMHRVIFGEYIPLKDLFPWLSALTPFGPNYGISAGTRPAVFEYNNLRMAPLICFEDTVPQLVRNAARQSSGDSQTVDLLVNLTNDAWFRGSSELDQHLITSVFRCIETRTPLVRAVNGGISAFIDGNGQIREPEQILVLRQNNDDSAPVLEEVQGMRDPTSGVWRRQFEGIVFGQVPLDPRNSFYLQTGDWFAIACLGVATIYCLRKPR